MEHMLFSAVGPHSVRSAPVELEGASGKYAVVSSGDARACVGRSPGHGEALLGAVGGGVIRPRVVGVDSMTHRLAWAAVHPKWDEVVCPST